MGKIVIKKRVSLEFLGEEYKEAYLEFKSIPLSQFGEYVDKSKNEDESQSANLIIETLETHFLSGKFPDDDGNLFDVTKDQIKDFDVQTAITTFKVLTGQELDPK